MFTLIKEWRNLQMKMIHNRTIFQQPEASRTNDYMESKSDPALPEDKSLKF